MVADLPKSHGLQLSEAKTQAMMCHPHGYRAPRLLTLHVQPLPWCLRAKYLVLLIVRLLT